MNSLRAEKALNTCALIIYSSAHITARIIKRWGKKMAKISDVVKLKSGYANFVHLKEDFEATQMNADRMAMYRPLRRTAGV
jgi:hypothetical protein